MDGLAEHGYGYNLSAVNLPKLLQQGNAALQDFKDLPLSTPGLFNLPVCVVTDLGMMPDSGQVQEDYLTKSDVWTNPCECGNFNITVPGGEKQFFKDHVNKAIYHAIICDTAGGSIG